MARRGEPRGLYTRLVIVASSPRRVHPSACRRNMRSQSAGRRVLEESLRIVSPTSIVPRASEAPRLICPLPTCKSFSQRLLSASGRRPQHIAQRVAWVWPDNPAPQQPEVALATCQALPSIDLATLIDRSGVSSFVKAPPWLMKTYTRYCTKPQA